MFYCVKLLIIPNPVHPDNFAADRVALPHRFSLGFSEALHDEKRDRTDDADGKQRPRQV